MQRHLLGLMAAVALIAAVALWLFQAMASAGSHLTYVLLRIGLILGVVWLAFPQVTRLAKTTSRGMLGLLLGAIVLVALRPMLIPYVLVALVVGWLLMNRINPKAIMEKFGPVKRRARQSNSDGPPKPGTRRS